MLKLPFAFCQSQFFSKPFCKIQPTIMKGFDVVSSSTIMLSNALQITLVQRGECWSLQKSNTANVSSGWCKILESRIFLHLEFGAVAWPTRSSHRCDLLFRVSSPKLVASVRNVESPLLCCPFLFCPFEALELLTGGTETTSWHERFFTCLLTTFALVIPFRLIILPLLT